MNDAKKACGGSYNWDEQVGISNQIWRPKKSYFWDEAEENAEYNWDEQVGQPHGYTPGEWDALDMQDEQVGQPHGYTPDEWDALDMQATLQGFEKFDHKWHQFTTHQSIEKFTTPGNFLRRLKAIQKKN
jgi:hypothetical protein